MDTDEYPDDFIMERKLKHDPNLLAEFRKRNKYYYSVNRKKNPMDRTYYVLNYYASGGLSTPIRNAITGEEYRHCLVGSSSEDLFFKMKICNGETGRSGVTLFYDSPESCMRHQGIVVSDSVIEAWNERYAKAASKIRKLRNRAEAAAATAATV